MHFIIFLQYDKKNQNMIKKITYGQEGSGVGQGKGQVSVEGEVWSEEVYKKEKYYVHEKKANC